MSATPLSKSVLTPAAPNRAAEIVEMESLMSLDAPIESKVMPRWERKKLQKLAAAGEGAASGACHAAGAGDRFIPNRSAMHMEKAHYALSKENVGSNPQGEGAGAIDAADEVKAGAGVSTQEAATVEKKGASVGSCLRLPSCVWRPCACRRFIHSSIRPTRSQTHLPPIPNTPSTHRVPPGPGGLPPRRQEGAPRAGVPQEGAGTSPVWPFDRTRSKPSQRSFTLH